MKPVIIIAIAFVLLIPIGSSNLIQQSYAQSEDLEGIELELVGWKKIESDKSDVLILTISFINNGKYVSDIIPNYVFLVDSQERTFGPSFYSDLQENGFPITLEDCPTELHTSSNPGLSSEEILCYEVPKGIGDSFSLNLWSSLPSLCAEYYICTIISLSVTLTQQSESNNSTSEIPDWVKNNAKWWSDNQIDDTTFVSGIKFLITEKILLIPQTTQGTSTSEKIPSWIKNTAGFWADGQIGNTEFLSAMQFLIKEGILNIEEQQTQIDPPSLDIDVGPSNDVIETTQIRDLCYGNARCILGVVTKVIDGDTIEVDGQSIRFALASAPELGSYGAGVKETEFIQNICPVGSTVIVDEDDKQTQGSYGRIVGVIYCNGLNLNSELLDSGMGYLESRFCDSSEFANTNWAIKHGCESKVTITENDCDPSYPDFCIPSSPPDLDCKDIPQKKFTVLQPDPHRFDGDKDGIGCES